MADIIGAQHGFRTYVYIGYNYGVSNRHGHIRVVKMNKEEKKAYNKTYYKAHSKKARAYSKTYRKANPEKVKAYQKAWRKANSEKRKADLKVYYKTNSDKAKAYSKAWREANPEKRRARQKAWYEANHEKVKADTKAYRKAHCEQIKAREKAYRKAHSEKSRGTSRKRRALKRTSQVEPINEKIVYLRDGWICQICHKRVDKRFKYPHPMSASLDHIIPLSQGGPHLYRNVHLAHWGCNSHKHDGTLPQGEQMRLF